MIAALVLAAVACDPGLNSLDWPRLGLVWDPVPGAERYELWVRESFGGTWAFAAALPCHLQPYGTGLIRLCAGEAQFPTTQGSQGPVYFNARVNAPVLRYVDRASGVWYDLTPVAVIGSNRSALPGIGQPERFWPTPNANIMKICWPAYEAFP